jgi:hypothetical protein
MKKQLNVDLIKNELRGGSAFFPGYKGSNSSVKEEKLPDHSPNQEDSPLQTSMPVTSQTDPVPSVRDVRPVLPVPPVPLKRVMKQRWPVDIYQDQYESIKQLAAEERMQGGIGSMSAMIREALDKLIAERRKK